ncbi:MAG TPA: hypothetical protein VIM51_07845 [Desulfosporosinus sp.]
MNQVFIMLFFLSLIVLLIGFFKPNAVLPGKIAKTRSHVWLVYGSAATIFFVLFGMTLPAIQATTSQESDISPFDLILFDFLLSGKSESYVVTSCNLPACITPATNAHVQPRLY